MVKIAVTVINIIGNSVLSWQADQSVTANGGNKSIQEASVNVVVGAG
ncbi:hypothetical protein [Izhakiella capsodis]|nr:hypothetical protein [Izhakiella capsodis]